MMKFVLKVFILLAVLPGLAVEISAQKVKPTPRPKYAPAVKNDQAEFEKALATADKNERVAALQEYLRKFPESLRRNEVLEEIAVTRTELATEKFKSRTTNEKLNKIANYEGIELLRLVIEEAPAPYSDKLHDVVIGRIPFNLLYLGERAAALEFAKLIEANIGDNAFRLLNLANFYIAVEEQTEAERLAEKAVALEPNSAQGYEILALAYRYNFKIEEAGNAYGKAVELKPDSLSAKRGLADMKRASGEFEEAVNLYRFVIAADEKDNQARTGLVISLLGAHKPEEAEKEMDAALEKNPNNLTLFTGAAYWYVAHGEAAKAEDVADEAIAVEPRSVWAHIALARSLIAQNRPLEAEKTLLEAKQFGNFPTLDYELANARFHAAFYEEAAEDLQRVFALRDGQIVTNLGGKVAVGADNFIALLDNERRAAIFQSDAAETPENAAKLKQLLTLKIILEDSAPNEAGILQAGKDFVEGKNSAQTFRRLYVAGKLLDKKIALSDVTEMTKEAASGVTAALDSSAAASGIMAEELYEPRRLANSRGEYLNLPEIPRQILDKLLRGKIEEIAGWSLYNQNKPAEAVVRLKRAVSVLPENTAWWRLSYWRLGLALDENKESKEALEAFIKSYKSSEPDAKRYAIIESVYRRVNGSVDGLEKRIGTAPKPPESLTTQTAKFERPKTSDTSGKLTAKEAKPKSETTDTTPIEVKKNEPPILAPTPTPEVAPLATPEQKPENPPRNEIPPEVKAEPKNEPPRENYSTLKIDETGKPPAETVPAKPAPEKPAETVKTDEILIETRPRIVKIESGKERKRRENDEREAAQKRQKEEENQAEERRKQAEEEKARKKNNESNGKDRKKGNSVETGNSESASDGRASAGQPSDLVLKSLPPNVENSRNQPPTEEKSNPPESPVCRLRILQGEILIPVNGYSASIAVDAENLVSVDDLKVTSMATEDLKIERDPEIARTKNGWRILYLIKSVTDKVGIYTVTFDSPCGKSDVTVKVK